MIYAGVENVGEEQGTGDDEGKCRHHVAIEQRQLLSDDSRSYRIRIGIQLFGVVYGQTLVRVKSLGNLHVDGRLPV